MNDKLKKYVNVKMIKEYLQQEYEYCDSEANKYYKDRIEIPENNNIKILIVSESTYIINYRDENRAPNLKTIIILGPQAKVKSIYGRPYDHFDFVFINSNFLKGNHLLLEGCKYIINNYDKFEDKENFVKALKSKSVKIRNLCVELLKLKNEIILKFLLDNKLLTYTNLIESKDYSLSQELNILILDEIAKSSVIEKEEYNKNKQRKDDLDIGADTYTIDDLKKQFNCKIEDGIIKVSKYNGKETTLVIPNSVDGIKNYEFKNLGSNSTVTKVIFETGIAKLDTNNLNCNGIFNSFKSLKEIILPNTVEYINPELFNNLKDVYLNMYDNPNFKILDDNIYCFNNELLCIRDIKQNMNIIIPEGVKVIKSSFFFRATALQSITFPKSLELICGNAFESCSKLNSIIFNGPLESELEIAEDAFIYCHNIKTLTLPEGFKKIEIKSFTQCTKLISLTIPASLEYIEKGFLFNNASLKCIEVDSNSQHFTCKDDILYNKDCTEIIRMVGKTKIKNLVLPETVKQIWDEAFYSCKSLKKVIIPDSVEILGSYSFCYCSSLIDIKLSKNIKILEKYVFGSCESLTYIDITYGIENIKRNVFWNCDKLLNVTLADSVKIIDSAFNHCTALEQINLPDNIIQLTGTFDTCKSLKSISLPNNIKEVGNRVFAHCESLESIVIPDSVEKINSDAFMFCKKLKNVTFSKNLKKIESHAFSCCGLESIELPEGLEIIEREAFLYNFNLSKGNIPSTVTHVGNKAFADVKIPGINAIINKVNNK